VLVIDGDLRRPRIHEFLKTRNVRGLTSLVLGQRELDEVIRALPDVPSMDIINSGPVPPNPPEVFAKATFKRVLNTARERYDWVVIDTPPVTSVTDPVICASLCDMALLVVQYGRARRQLIRGAVRQLSRAGVRVAGVVMNRVDVKREHSYYYSYSYLDGYETEAQPS
jgi:capsular exopolysaccharide synthesis family protein